MYAVRYKESPGIHGLCELSHFSSRPLPTTEVPCRPVLCPARYQWRKPHLLHSVVQIKSLRLLNIAKLRKKTRCGNVSNVQIPFVVGVLSVRVCRRLSLLTFQFHHYSLSKITFSRICWKLYEIQSMFCILNYC